MSKLPAETSCSEHFQEGLSNLFMKNELLLKASQAATEHVNEDIIFLDPEIYWELKVPPGALECYFYYDDNHRNTREIIVHVFFRGTDIVTRVSESPLKMSI